MSEEEFEKLSDIDQYKTLLMVLNYMYGGGCAAEYNGKDNFEKNCSGCWAGALSREAEEMIEWLEKQCDTI